MTVTTKFRCTFKTARESFNGPVYDITLRAVADGSEENKRFFRYTPSGQITFTAVDGPAAEYFVVNREFYVEFNPCPINGDDGEAAASAGEAVAGVGPAENAGQLVQGMPPSGSREGEQAPADEPEPGDLERDLTTGKLDVA